MYKFITKFLLVIFALSFTPSFLSASGEGDIAVIEGVVPISISQTKELLKEKNTYLFDANTKEARDEYGYIANSVHINVDNWESLLPEDKNANLVFYCLNRLCFDSSEAAMIAMSKGYKNSYVMLDGVEKWILNGNPVERVPGTDNSLIKKVLASDELTKREIKDYHDNIHSQVTFGKTPSCRDCHGEDVKEPGGMPSVVKFENSSKRMVNDNCVSCHKDATKKLSASVHSQRINPGSNVPKCTDCHSIHLGKEFDIAGTAAFNFRQLSDTKCGTCHTKEQKHYHESFHGKAMLLNSKGTATSVAACYDCHGKHGIFEVSDKRSKLSSENRVETCAKCHPGSNEKFAGFIAHADHTDKTHYPTLYWTYIFMTGLLISVFGFFGLHTFLWSIKLIKTRLDYPKEWKEAKEKMHNDRVKVKRFSALHKWQHFFMGISFLGLTFSGIPQKFYTASWAGGMIDMMGGPIGATKVHHISAIVMGLVFFSHICEIVFNAYKNRDAIRNPQTGKLELSRFWGKLFGPDSLMPRWQDFRDIRDHFKWFFGKGPRPQFDRWTYWEKFDYLAVFWGMFIIGLSGLVLWFPVFFTQFLPGWMINLCTILHSDEALLATGFIFAVHFFNTHFRADRFPMDMVIFSGNLSEEEIKHERMSWYERLKENGKLSKLIVKDDSFASWSWFAKLVGFAMLIVGMFFLFLIIYSFIERIF